MELRPELTPPVLDEALVARLARLADRLDGAAVVSDKHRRTRRRT